MTKHKLYVRIVICILIMLNEVAAASLPTGNINQLQELYKRDGLPNFFTKIRNGDPVKVAYLGGSITEQEGWRVYSLEWFRKRYPDAKFSEVNAAIGGTPSEFGAFRLQDHALAFHPDLIFVEFAVNDKDAGEEKVIRSMEGIVRQVWQTNSHVDICFVYTIRESYIETESHGILPFSVSAAEAVARKYGIPSINFGVEVCRRIEEKRLVFKAESKEINGIQVFGPDGTHPYIETGHSIYHEVLRRSFEAMEAMNRKMKAKAHTLQAPIHPYNLSDVRMIDIMQLNLKENQEIPRAKEFLSLERFLPHISKQKKDTETIVVRFKGRAIGAYDLIGPGGGRVIVEVDGCVKDTMIRFDKYCTYYRMNYFLIDDLENKDHDVIFRVFSEPFNKKAILKETLQEDFIKYPDKYKEYCWYVGKILIDGNLIQ
ncbi:MAG: SGNH/GDSL hydrolase family protein [Mangrovibacterium sp.]